MLKITIAQRGYAAEDVTNRLDAESDPVMDCIRERNAFKRAYSDVSLRLNNSDGYFTRLFLSKVPSTWWEVEVWDDNRRNFVGRIATPINFDLNTEWVNLTVFSIDKLFWERAASATINIYPKTSQSFSNFKVEFDTVSKVLNAVLLLTETQPLRAVGVTVIDIDSIYSGKTIDSYPNRKRLKESTTVESLLLAMGMYYNAEFFIDPFDMHFKMKQRQTVLNDRRTDIDDVLQDDGEITVEDSDEQSFDYIHALRGFDKADAPVLVSLLPDQSSGLEASYFAQYIVTYLLSYDGVNQYESEPSFPSNLLWNGSTRSWAILNLPIGGQYVVGRVLYRNVGDGSYRRVATISDNTTILYTDNMSFYTLSLQELLVTQMRPLHFWYRYNETTGVWEAPVTSQNSDDAPLGRIFDITPKLEFIDDAGNNSTSDITDSFMFFGNEQTLAAFIERWKPLFITHRRIICALRGKNYAVGDSLVSTLGRFPNDFTIDKRMVMKNPKVHLVKEYTDAELFTI